MYDFKDKLFIGIVAFCAAMASHWISDNLLWPSKYMKETDLIERRAQEIYIDYKAQELVEERLDDEQQQ